MASSDPKKTRDFERTSDREDYEADEDPLVELARIVSEDGGFSGRMTKRPRVEQPEPPADEHTFSSDLEAELMHELETSLSTRQAPPPRSEPRSEAKTAPVAPPQPEPMDEPKPIAERYAVERAVAEMPAVERDNSDDLLRSIEEQLSQFEQRVRAHSFAAEDEIPVADEEVDWSDRDREADAAAEPHEWQEVPRMASPQSEYRFRGPAGTNWDHRVEQVGGAPEFAEPFETPMAVAGAAHAEDRFGRQGPVPAEADDDHVDYAEEARRRIGEPQARTAFAAETDAAATTPGARDFASLEAELSRELDSAYSGQDADEEPGGDGGSDEAPRVAAAVIAPEHGMRPPPPPRAAAPAARGSRRGLATAAAIVIVVAIGGAGAMYLRSFDRSASGPPPVIAAPDGPVKIEPVEAQDGGEQTVGDAVYDRVAGQNTGAQEGTEENVVEGAEEPQEIARIVVPPAESRNGETLVEPGGEAAVAGAGESEPVAAEAQGGEEEFGPRRVPTYVVRPDGTIVATAEAESHAGEPDLAGQQMATAQTEAMEPKPVETVIIDEPRVAGSPGSTTMAVESEPPARTDDVMDEAPAIVEESTEAAPEEEATELAELRPSEEPAVSEPSPAPAEQPTQAAASEPEPTETPVPPTATSGYLVQLSATGSPEEAEATYDRLQSRHASILGNLDPNIQRADLGERGVFYRVRVGPWQQRDEAIGVCDALKAAGADCYVTQ